MPTQRSTHSSKSSKKEAPKKAASAAKTAPVKAKAKAGNKEERSASKDDRTASDRRADERRTDQRLLSGDRRTEERRDARPAGADATGPADFVVTRKWHGKALESHVGAHVRVELPESTLRGMSWQLHKLPHGVELSGANVEHLAKPAGQVNQNRVFDFALTEEGEYLLQFSLQRPFDQRGVADTFKIKLQASTKN